MLSLLFIAALHFVSDVQLSGTDPYPEQATAAIAARIGSGTVYDAGDVAEHAWPDEYARYQALYPLSIPVPGNHDWYSPGLAAWPWTQVVDVVDQGVHLVGFDTGLRANPAQVAMLATLLTAADLPTVLYLHHPLFSANLRVGGSATQVRQHLLPTVEAADVDLVISGHGHAYERHEYGGRTFVVIGTGGAHLDQVGTAPTLRASVSSHGWFEIVPRGDAIDCTFRDATGNAMDTFTVNHRAAVATESETWGGIKALYR